MHIHVQKILYTSHMQYVLITGISNTQLCSHQYTYTPLRGLERQIELLESSNTTRFGGSYRRVEKHYQALFETEVSVLCCVCVQYRQSVCTCQYMYPLRFKGVQKAA